MDPAKARTMLREFAVYYRRLLENSEDLIPLAAEIEQTERYLMFQKARFGEENILMETTSSPGSKTSGSPPSSCSPSSQTPSGMPAATTARRCISRCACTTRATA